MLRYKITPPVVERSMPRPRLLDAALAGRCTVLAAPAGHGKTCLATQLAEVLPGPTAWFSADELDRDLAGVVAHLLAALGQAWPDLAGLAPTTVDDDAALPLLAAAMETMAGPGCLVIDDAHRLPAPVVDAVARVAVDALPAQCRLVVCTRHGVPEPLVRAEAAGTGITLGPDDLVFTADECAALHPTGAAAGAELRARTGGWPLAVALSVVGDPDPPTLRHAEVLTDLALGELPREARDLLATLARLPRFPSALLAAGGDAARCAIEDVARRQPAILEPADDGWWVVREWLSDALGIRPVAPAAFAAVTEALRRLDQRELLVHLLLSDGRQAEAVTDIEQLARAGARDQRWGWVRALVAGLPAPARTLELDLLAARAAHALNLLEATTLGSRPRSAVLPHADDVLVSERSLLELVERTAADGTPAQLLEARSVLADHYRWAGDIRLLGVCEQALGDALHTDDPGALAERWSPDEAAAAGVMLRLYGLALLLSSDGEVVERGRRLLAEAVQLVDGHKGNVSERAWLAYTEALLWLRPQADAVRLVRPRARHMQERHQFDAALRLGELAVLEHFAGDAASARRNIEVARECADRTGHAIVDTPLDAVEAVLDITEHGLDPGRAERFDSACGRFVDHPRLRPFASPFAAELAMQLIWHGDLAAARHYLEWADETAGTTLFGHVAELNCHRVRGLLLVAEGDAAGGDAVLDELRAACTTEGRLAMVERVDIDRARLATPATETATAGERRSVDGTSRPGPMSGTRNDSLGLVGIEVRVLGPVLEVTIAGEPAPPPRGYPAKLLALLIVADGIMTVDAAIEGLWPGADPDLGRNRLYGVLLRLRRGLGLPVDGPITCVDGLVRLEGRDGFTIDAWTFEQGVRRRADPFATALRYTGDVLSEQFAYDDTVEAYRTHLRRSFLDLARAALRAEPAADHTDDEADVARRAELARRVERCSA